MSGGDRFRDVSDLQIIAAVAIFVVIRNVKEHLDLLGMLFNHLVLDHLVYGDRSNFSLQPLYVVKELREVGSEGLDFQFIHRFQPIDISLHVFLSRNGCKLEFKVLEPVSICRGRCL